MDVKHIIIEEILLPAIKRLYKIDYDNIRLQVSERNICARLALHIENIMYEYDQLHENKVFEGYYADIEYNRMGDGDLKQYENSDHRPKYMVSDLLIHSRGYERNLLAVEMKKKGNYRNNREDRERLMSLVSSAKTEVGNQCVHDTLLGTFMIYSPEEVYIEYYENVDGLGTMTNRIRIPIGMLINWYEN